MAQYIDPGSLYKTTLIPWQEYWNECASIWDNLSNLIDGAILLPDHKAQRPIVVAYLLLNQKFAFTLPYLFLWGKSGSSKSQVIKIAKHLHNVGEIFGPDSTFASMRNELDAQFWLDREMGWERNGAILLLDNIWQSTLLLDPKLFAMFLKGYERLNATTTMSGEVRGENRTFHTFTTKLVSSVESFNDPKLREIERRLLTIRTKKLDEFTTGDFDGSEGSFDIDDVLDLDAVNWEGFYGTYSNFWDTPSVCHRYVELRSRLTDGRTKLKKRFIQSYPWLNNDLWKILIDLICTIVVAGGASDENGALDLLDDFFSIWEVKRNTHKTSSEVLIAQKIDDLLRPVREVIQRAGNEGITDKSLIPKEEIDKRLLWAFVADNQAYFECAVNQAKLHEIMQGLGWTAKGRKWIKS